MFPRRHFLLAVFAAPLGIGELSLCAAEGESATAGEPFTPSPEFQELITRLAREHLPDKYEKSKNWGETTRVFDGWKLERDGLRIETRRRFKEAKDGAWQKYSILLLEPEKQFEIRVANLRQRDNQMVCDVTVVAAARVSGRHTQWENGVQLVSISAEAETRLRLRAEVAVAMKLDPAKFPPDIYLEPRVTQADLDILEFKLRRISHFDGPLVKSLSSSVREVLEDKIEADRKKLVASLNKSLAKQQSKIRFSAADWLSSVGEQLGTAR
jgi:hypothetical protein